MFPSADLSASSLHVTLGWEGTETIPAGLVVNLPSWHRGQEYKHSQGPCASKLISKHCSSVMFRNSASSTSSAQLTSINGGTATNPSGLVTSALSPQIAHWNWVEFWARIAIWLHISISVMEHRRGTVLTEDTIPFISSYVSVWICPLSPNVHLALRLWNSSYNTILRMECDEDKVSDHAKGQVGKKKQKK